MRTDVLGVGFDDVTLEEALNSAETHLDGRAAAYVVTPNPEIVWECRKDPGLKEIISDAALVLPDGIGIVLGAKILKRPLKGKIAGFDFAERLMERMSATHKSVFLFGAKTGVADLAAENLKAKYPGLVIAGTRSGYFSDDGPIVNAINAASPDLLIVGLGAPKQERWMTARRSSLRVGLMAGLGGALDGYAGTFQRAPQKWRDANLEWLYRLIKEPKRIRRQIRLPLFLLAVVGQRLRGR